MEKTPNLTLPYADPARAQHHVNGNEALRRLDAIVQLVVLDRDLTAPPGAPANGARYIVGAAATGAWAGQDGRIAAFQDGAWSFYVPAVGWVAWIADEAQLVAWSGAAWVVAGGSITSLNPATGDLVGVNATADANNRLAVASPASLFNHAGNGHQVKVNKAAAGDTASVLFQTAFSGRAEFGLTGDDDWHVKVSPDGATWFDAVIVDRASGRIRFPSGGVREQLTAGRTYYVRTDGSDANNGLTDSAGGAFATIQHAIDWVIGSLDIGANNVTIQVGAGTYAENVRVTGVPVGTGKVTVIGDETTPANVVISGSGNCVDVSNNGIIDVRGFRMVPGTGSHCMNVSAGLLFFRNVEFGATTGTHMVVGGLGVIQATGDYSIIGSAARHFLCSRGGQITATSKTITLTGAFTFTDFAAADQTGRILANGCTFPGPAATGRRYSVQNNAVIKGGGTAYFPGDVVGVSLTGGQYS